MDHWVVKTLLLLLLLVVASLASHCQHGLNTPRGLGFFVLPLPSSDPLSVFRLSLSVIHIQITDMHTL